MANALPLILLAGGAAALVIAGKKRKRRSSGTGGYQSDFEFPPPAPADGGSGTSSKRDLEPMVVEQLLFDIGYPPGTVDGAYDADTVVAIKAFQQDWNALMEWVRNRYPQLVGKAEYKNIGTDGAWGPATEARAVRAADMVPAGGATVSIEGKRVPVANFREYVIKTHQA